VRLLRGFLTRHQNLLLAVALALLSLALGLATGLWPLQRLAYLLGGLIPLSYLWARLQLWGLAVRVERPTGQGWVGRWLEGRLILYNDSPLPKLGLEVEEVSDMPGYRARAVINVAGWGRHERPWRALCLRRGLFRMGPLVVTAGDPFGLFSLRRSFGPPAQLLVFPQVVELPHFWAPPASLAGEGRHHRHTPYIAPSAAGLREYQPGDSLSRIHWPSSARTGRLMVKTFEMEAAGEAWVVLDLEGRVQAGEGDEGTEEWAIKAAAAVAWALLRARRPVGLLYQGLALEPERGQSQLLRILEALATARAEGDRPLAHLLLGDAHRFGRHSTLVIITPATEGTWVEALGGLLRRGVRAIAILLDPATFGAPRSTLPIYSSLVALDVPVHLLRRGEDLAAALRPAGLSLLREV